MPLGWWVTVPTSRRIFAVKAAATAQAPAPTTDAAPVIQAVVATATAQAHAPAFTTTPFVSINAPAATATARMEKPTPAVEPRMDVFLDFQTMPNTGTITLPGWTTTQSGAGSALPSANNGRYVQNSTGSQAAASYLTHPLTLGARIAHSRSAFEIVSNTSTATADIIFFEQLLNQGYMDGRLLRSSIHVVFTRVNYIVQMVNTQTPGIATNLYSVYYPVSPGGAVQFIVMTLDLVVGALTVTGGDGVTRRHPTVGGDSNLLLYPGYYATAEIYDGNPAADDTRFLYFGADSVVRAAAYVPPNGAARATAVAVSPVLSMGALINSPAATATAAAIAPQVSGAINIVAATATADAPAPAVSTGSVDINAVAATATATAPAPAPSGAASISAVTATATTDAPAPVVSIKANYSDDFNRADSSTLGTGWTGRSNQMKIASNVAVPDTLSAFCLDSYDSAVFTDDHKCSVVINTAPTGTELALLYVRSNNTDSQIYAYCLNGSQWVIYSKSSTYSGSLVSPTLRAITGGNNSYTGGDTLSFDASGNVYTIRKNGTSVLTWTDSSNVIPTGSTHREVAFGYLATSAGHGLDSWTAVDL